MRTYDEITAKINAAITLSDHTALFYMADEMSAIDSDQVTLAAPPARAKAYRLYDNARLLEHQTDLQLATQEMEIKGKGFMTTYWLEGA